MPNLDRGSRKSADNGDLRNTHNNLLLANGMHDREPQANQANK